MSVIKNKQALLSHGNVEGRRIALDIIEYAIKAVDAYELVRKVVFVEGQTLSIDGLKYDLSSIRNIYVIGAGKGSVRIAEALEDILGDRISAGIIIEKRGHGRKLRTVKVLEGGHPIPDEAGLEAAKEVVEIAKRAQDGDLVFACITGGCSALMPLPADGISLDDKKRVTELLLKCGATIDEINAVRNHISAIKGGRLAMYAHPAEIVNLILIDEVAGLPWGPTVPDPTTFSDSVRILKKYRLWDSVPDSVRRHLEMGLSNQRMETPKPEDFKRLKVHNVVLASIETACEAAKRRAEELGLNSVILSTMLEGESREAGIVLASIAKEVERKYRPIKPPCALIAGGETTVTIADRSGEGGPSQELALSFSLKIHRSKKITLVSVDTDGTDGPTDVAGGIVDGYTLDRAKEKGIDVYENLMGHASSYMLKELEDVIITGPTGTNVADLNVIVVDGL
ncbi:MAG: glycerate kinase [Nitrososphaerota archaeon]|nr:glycerate kinase [Aigarchaeota archaeon]MDW8076403.1 glycerate kinase [Nitrososphaerota archaeon]